MIAKNLMSFYYLKNVDFYSHLNIEDITDADYLHAERVCKDFKITKVAHRLFHMG